MVLSVLVPKEICHGETRVAATPETVKIMVKKGFHVVVQSKAGEGAQISDEEYASAGAKIGTDIAALYESADIVLGVQPPQFHHKAKRHQLDMMKKGSCWISFMNPQLELDSVAKMVENHITAFSMTLIPRISRAQRMDALTSQSNIAGYKAVIVAACELGKMFPMMMTASGTIHPAKVVILGAGVAGLQAIATAKRLGAQVEVSDVRPSVKEQVESLGAKFIEVPFDKDAEDGGGYAKGASPEYLQRQSVEIAKRLSHADVVITAALVFGKKAPILLTEEMVKSMKKGAVIVDMAAEQGGNCALTKPGETVVNHGVKIVGLRNLPATVPLEASNMYAKNVLHFLLDIVKEGKLDINMGDEVIAGSLVAHDGKRIHKDKKDSIKK
jgi:H+-translocating NAD(P) transhydrogenase subunit alpha